MNNYCRKRGYSGSTSIPLAIGVMIGVLCAILLSPNLFQGPAERLAKDQIASVNGTPITRLEYEQILSRISEEAGTAISEKDQILVLSRLIDEALILQNGIKLNMALTNPNVRQEIYKAMESLIIDSSNYEIPSATELNRFYLDNCNLFEGKKAGECSKMIHKDNINMNVA